MSWIEQEMVNNSSLLFISSLGEQILYICFVSLSTADSYKIQSKQEVFQLKFVVIHNFQNKLGSCSIVRKRVFSKLKDSSALIL